MTHCHLAYGHGSLNGNHFIQAHLRVRADQRLKDRNLNQTISKESMAVTANSGEATSGHFAFPTSRKRDFYLTRKPHSKHAGSLGSPNRMKTVKCAKRIGSPFFAAYFKSISPPQGVFNFHRGIVAPNEGKRQGTRYPPINSFAFCSCAQSQESSPTQIEAALSKLFPKEGAVPGLTPVKASLDNTNCLFVRPFCGGCFFT